MTSPDFVWELRHMECFHLSLLPGLDEICDDVCLAFCEIGLGVFSGHFGIGASNRLNILHGGTIASMVDLGGSLAVASHGLFATGVSTDLNVTYLSSGGKVGDKILAEVSCDKFGKTLAYTSIKFFNSKGEIVARGSHTKYIALAWKDPQNIAELGGYKQS
ncbi:PaaI family thioesterase [Aspergillus tanneri]|uniref:Thioesterase domain-containing protein n=1 Tax=Aspergillus tanneri TaxID=1220188 RepID=A0A5M9MZH8_9EURO|nr:uncharacterized protein ATNIH1004_002750 [Aspergillus tanneri]KAA8650069.1 hypothetical protein ATNIH1004_002750 [Aspergillus tanneri]